MSMPELVNLRNSLASGNAFLLAQGDEDDLNHRIGDWITLVSAQIQDLEVQGFVKGADAEWLGLPVPNFIGLGYSPQEVAKAIQVRTTWLAELIQELAKGGAVQDVKEDSRKALPVDRRHVFVVHGRDGPLRDSMFAFLRAIGLAPIEWSQAVQETGKASPYVGEILDAAFAKAIAVVVLMTPDDLAHLRRKLQSPHDLDHERSPTPQARANVLFEAGMAMGRHPERTVLAEIGTLRPFSDAAGRHVIRMNNSTQRRQELAQRLQTAGCAVDLSGTDWHIAGNFDAPAIEDASSAPPGQTMVRKYGAYWKELPDKRLEGPYSAKMWEIEHLLVGMTALTRGQLQSFSDAVSFELRYKEVRDYAVVPTEFLVQKGVFTYEELPQHRL